MTGQSKKAVILAAGRSKRMKSSLSKVVTPILGKPILLHLLDSLQAAGIGAQDTILVVAPDHDDVRRAVGRPVTYAIQQTPLGTGHAFMAAMPFLEGFLGDVLVTVGDNPYIQGGDIKELFAQHKSGSIACTLLSAIFPGKPPPYGRVIRGIRGEVLDVVEELDATPEQLAIPEVNASVYLFDFQKVAARMSQIDNHNKKGEYYLTDIVGILNRDGQMVKAVPARDFRVSIGVNNKWELAEAIEFFNRQNMKRLAEENGVLFLQPSSTTVEMGVDIGADTVVHPCTYLGGALKIGERCQIGPFVRLLDGQIADDQIVAGGNDVG